jgi:1,2-diacylglycerol 3-alpha-glucosyltransferase
MENRNKQKKLPKKSWFNIVFFVISILGGLLVSMIALDQDLGEFNFASFLQASSQWLPRWYMMAIAFILMVVMAITSGLRMHVLLKVKRKRTRFFDSLYYGLIAKYYVLITPWALGGQPITMGIMYKRNIPIGLATAVPVVDLFFMRLAMAMISIIALVGFSHLIDPWVLLFAWIGYFFSCIVPLILIISSLHPQFALIYRTIVYVFWPKKKREKALQKWLQGAEQYREAFALFRDHRQTLFAVFLHSLASQFALVAIPYFVLGSFTINDNPAIAFTFINILAISSMTINILGIVPTLGSAGAAEFTFVTVFGLFVSGTYLFWVTFIWRIFIFYAWLMMGMLATIILGLFSRSEKRRHHIPNMALPLRVYLFNDGFFPLIDGVVRAIDGYARYLTSQGIEVTVVVPYSGNSSQFPYRIIPIKQFKIPGFFYPISYGYNHRKIEELLYYEGPTIYHAHTPFMLGQLALRLSKQHNIPLVTTFHSKYYDDYLQVTKSDFLATILRDLTVLFFKKSQATWTVSEATKRTMVEYGIAQRDIKVIPNGTSVYEHPLAMETAASIKTLYALKDIPTFLFVGQLIWQKNIKLILDTFKQLELLGFAYQALIVGEGRNEKDIQVYCASLGLHARVIFTGKISDPQQLSGCYKLAQLFFFPSAYDNDPMVIKEAAVHQVPTLALAGTNAAEPIIHNVNGFVIAGDAAVFAQTIIHIFANQESLKKIGMQAQATIVKRWEQTLKPLVEDYKLIIKEFYQ